MLKRFPFFDFLQTYSIEKRKIRVPFIFLIITIFFWLSTKFSNHYIQTVNFDVVWENYPPDLIFDNEEKVKIQATLNASGFNFFLYSFSSKEIKIDLADAVYKENEGQLILANNFQGIKNQIIDEVDLLSIYPTTLKFKFKRQVRKKIPVRFNQKITLDRGYDFSQKTIFNPDSIWVSGPREQMDSLKNIELEKVNLPSLNKDMDVDLTVKKRNKFVFESEKVQMRIKVERFSEKSFIVPIGAINVPTNTAIKLFPKQVKVVFSAPLEEMKEMQLVDFEFMVNYEAINLSEKGRLEIELVKYPKKARYIRWEPKQVEYLIRE